jgi:sulfite reductase (NADPH) hemoprotein beta-component
MRMLAHIARTYDKGYGHFTTRQNIQFNWPSSPTCRTSWPMLADVEMHAIQTSGNCIRNVTADHFAGAAADEIEPIRALVRNPAPMVDAASGILVPAAQVQDRGDRGRARSRGDPVHDIGLHLKKNAEGELGFRGLGRRRLRAARR